MSVNQSVSQLDELLETLTNSQQVAQALLTDLALQKEKFDVFSDIAFGNNFNFQKLQEIREKWSNQDFTDHPEIKIFSTAEINGANGAFSPNLNQFFVAQEYLLENQSQPEKVVDVLLEEIGHYVDIQVNKVDAEGDEGAIFSKLVKGVELTETQLLELKSEDDTATITLGGEVIQIEQNINDVTNIFNQIKTTFDQAEGILNTVTTDLGKFLTTIQDSIDSQIYTDLPLLGDQLKDSTEKAINFIENLNSDIFEELYQFDELIYLSTDTVKQVLFNVFSSFSLNESIQSFQDIPKPVVDQFLTTFQSEISNGKAAISEILSNALDAAIQVEPSIFAESAPSVDQVLDTTLGELSQRLLINEVLEQPLKIISNVLSQITEIENIPKNIPENILIQLLNTESDINEDNLRNILKQALQDLEVTAEDKVDQIISELEEGLNGLEEQFINGFLQKISGDKINLSNIVNNNGDLEFDITLNFEDSVELIDEIPVSDSIDLVLLQLDFEDDSSFGVNLGYDINLTFGYDSSINNLSFDTSSPDPEIGINLDLEFPEISAKIAEFLQVNLENKRTGLNFEVDLTGQDLDSVNFTSEGHADLNFHLKTELAGLPSIQSDLNIDWNFTDSDKVKVPEINFNDIQLNLGSFFNDFAEPIVEKVNNILKPLKPIKEKLTTNVTGLDKIGIEINLLNTVLGINDDIGIFSAIDVFEEFEKFFSDESNEILINFGSFKIGENQEIITTLEANPYNEALDNDLVGNKNNSSGFLSSVNSYDESDGDEGVEFSFPILEEPSEVFKLLLGQDADLVKLKLPGFDTGEKPFGPPPYPFLIPPGIPAKAEFGGTAEISIPEITLGYDTEGFKTGDLLQGFYIDGTQPILEAKATLEAKAVAGVENLMSVGGKIWLDGKLDIFLAEPIEEDGQVRFDEIEESFSGDIECFFDITGGVNVGATLWAEHITYKPRKLIKAGLDWVRGEPVEIVERYNYPIAERNLFSFDHKCDDENSLRPNLATPLPINVETSLPDVEPDVELRLNLGEFAEKRNIQPKTIDETFYITSDVIVSAFGEEDPLYSDISIITAYAHTGNDVIYLSEEVITRVEFHGGEGDDELYGRSGNDQLFGDAGSDRLDGGEGNDILDGGEGEDRVFGDAGEDTLQGNSGDDFLDGGAENDQLDGGEGNDEVYGRSGDDFLDGGSGDDQLNGGEDQDTLEGQAGVDLLDGGSGDDILNGGNDSDLIFGDTGSDVVDGGEGNDILDGGEGDDFVKGSEGDDQLWGGSQVEIEPIFDENGEQVFDEEGQPLFKDPVFSDDLGSDTLEGGEGNDYIDGEAGDDFLTGDSGNDTINGDLGNDTVNYDNSPNSVTVNIDETTAYENTTSETDSIDLEGNFSIESGTAKDGFETQDSLQNLENIIGSEFNDVLIGNASDNEITALTGDDLVIGNAGDDNLDGGDGIDVVSYRRDPGSVNVNLSLGEATDGWENTDAIANIENVVGSEFNDNITGDAEINIITAGSGSDTVNSREGDDQLYGEADNDHLTAEQGNDLIDGGEGSDTVNYDNSPDRVIVNIDETHSYDNLGGFLHSTIVTDKLIPTDTEPEFAIAAGTAVDGFGTEDVLRNLENIVGSAFDDILIGNETDNRIEANDDNDLLVGNAGNDILDGGNDIDTASYRRDLSKVEVNLEQNFAKDGFAGTDTLISIENVVGSEFDDQIIGSEVDNIVHSGDGDDFVESRNGEDIIFGEAGKDTLYAEDGDDFLVGGEDGDILNGGNDVDTASYFTSSRGVAVSLETGKGWVGDAKRDQLSEIENLEGSEFEDFLYGDEGENILSGLAGDDLIKANAGDDWLDGGAGDDRLYGDEGSDRIEGQTGDDLLKGGEGNDQLDGGEDNDRLFGEAGSDTLEGNTGNDYLEGNEGSDQLFGSEGNDQLYGNEGEDYLDGGDGEDYLDGGSENDQLEGGEGDDQLYGQTGLDTLKGNAGDDYLEGNEGSDYLEGNEGNDRVFGQEGEDQILGGDGNDELDGGEGNDTLKGEAGNDQLYGQAGVDLLEGGDGKDVLFGGDDSDTLEGQADDDYLEGNEGDDWLYGNEGDDRLEGNEGDDEIIGGEGNDYAEGGTGEDWIEGNAGDDRLYGNEGFDYIEGGEGHDVLDGGEDDDFLYGNEGSDRLYGKEGEDYLDGDIGDDRLEGGDGDDQLLGQEGHDYLKGGDGEDQLEGGEGDDWLLGEAGVDHLEGNEGNDELDGGEGNDQLYGNEGNDTLEGSQGNDYLEGNEGDDQLDGGEGNDFLYGHEGEDVLNGGEGNDNLYGGEDNDQLTGGEGNDLLEGGDGSDQLEGNAGDDQLFGGEGNDTLNAGEGDDQVYGNAGDDRIDGGEGNDYIEAGTGNDQVTAGDGVDQIYGEAGHDTLDAGDGNDRVEGGSGDDILRGQAGNDDVIGGSGNDQLSGGDGNDSLSGGSGNDELDGGEGDNVLNGGSGNDSLTGGDDSDTFVLREGYGTDYIFNFQLEQDFIGLMGLTFEEIEIYPDEDVSDRAIIGVIETGERLAILEGIEFSDLKRYHFFPVTEVEEDEDSEEIIDADENLDSENSEEIVDSNEDSNESETEETVDSDNENSEETVDPDEDSNENETDETVDSDNEDSEVIVDSDENLDEEGSDETIDSNENETDETVDSDNEDSEETVDSDEDLDGSETEENVNSDEDLDESETEENVDSDEDLDGSETEENVDSDNEDSEDILDSDEGLDEPETDETVDSDENSDESETEETVDSDNENSEETVDPDEYSNESETEETIDSDEGLDDSETEGTVDYDEDSDEDETNESRSLPRNLEPENTLIQQAVQSSTASYDFAIIIPEIVPPEQPTMPAVTGNSTEATPEADMIQGSSNDDKIIMALAGNDTVSSGAGKDWISGNEGNDIIDAGTDSDAVHGGDGDDIIFGSAGDDWIRGNLGNDFLDGGENDDILDGDSGSDTLQGQGGNDWLNGHSNPDFLSGGAGEDTLFGEQDNDTLQGNAGDDVLFGNQGADLIEGNAGNDVLYGGKGNDTLSGNDGDDELYGDLGDDIVVGDAGDDAVKGGAGNDTLVGGEGNDELMGESGNDILIGVTLNATNPGQNEIDTLRGGQGNDTFMLGNNLQVFYMGGNDFNSGLEDYVLIEDFTVSEDKIQLHGSQDDYRLDDDSPQGLPQGIALYSTIDNHDELIAIIQETASLSLDDNDFQFV